MKIFSHVSYFLLCLFVAAGLSFAQDMDPEAGKLYNEGNKLLKAGNYNGAVENYDKALKIDADYRIHYQRGIALKNSGKNDQAEESFKSSINMKPDFEAGYNALGGVYFAAGNFPEAIKNFEKVLEVSKNNNVKNKAKSNLALAYARMGSNALADGNTDRAIENLKKAVEYNNNDAAYLSLAKVYSEIGEYDQSLQAAENALKHRSSISKGGPYYYMGVAHKNKGNTEKAKEMFNQARSDATYRKLVEYELSLLK
jgi:tetratricopeptide (TPR) repeat protein